MSTVIGAPVRLSGSFTDSTGSPVDPGAVTVHLSLPDGSTLNPAASRDAVGVYHYDYTPTLSGIHQFYFAGTGANASIQAPDIFTVAPVTTGALISLADAKEQLNKAPTSVNPASTDDAEILGFIRAASYVINHITGYTARTQFTEWLTPNWGVVNGSLGVYGSGYVSLSLARTPVLSVLSVQPQFYQVSAIDLTQQVVDADAGIVWVPTAQTFLGPCVVTYTAGRATVPVNLQTACRIIVQSLWETQRGPAFGGKPAFDSEEMMSVPGMGTSVPVHAMETAHQLAFPCCAGLRVSTSAVPKVAAYLYNLALNAPTIGAATGSAWVEVKYGGLITAEYAQRSLWIAAGDPDGTPPITGASSNQSWVGLGARQRDEHGTVHCYSEAWSGDDSTEAVVEAAYAIAGALEDLTRLDPTAGNQTNGFTSPGVTNQELRFGLSNKGILARVHFEFNFYARIGTP